MEMDDIWTSQFFLDLSHFSFSMHRRTGVVQFLELVEYVSGPDRNWLESTVWGDGLRAGTKNLNGSSQAA